MPCGVAIVALILCQPGVVKAMLALPCASVATEGELSVSIFSNPPAVVWTGETLAPGSGMEPVRSGEKGGAPSLSSA
jgi:hypothetical protein